MSGPSDCRFDLNFGEEAAMPSQDNIWRPSEELMLRVESGASSKSGEWCLFEIRRVVPLRNSESGASSIFEPMALLPFLL
ncbi:hypothetical protein ACFX19_024905 [Malus domestica]